MRPTTPATTPATPNDANDGGAALLKRLHGVEHVHSASLLHHGDALYNYDPVETE